MNEHALALLNILHPEGDTFTEITFIHPAPSRSLPGCITLSYPRPAAIEWDRLQKANDMGYGVYYRVLPSNRSPQSRGRGRETHSPLLTALWTDIDLGKRYDALGDIISALYNLSPPPTWIMSTGGGVHALWPLSTPVPIHNRDSIKGILRNIALAAHGDTAATDLARVLRLPGTANTKPNRKGARCTVLDRSGPSYPLASFSHYLPKPKPVIKRNFPIHRPSHENEPAFVRWFLNTTHPQGTRNGALNWVVHKMTHEGYAMADVERLVVPHIVACEYPEGEALRVIRSNFARPKNGGHIPSYVSARARTRMAARDAARSAS